MVQQPGTVFVYWEVDEFRKSLICEHFQTTWDNLPFYLHLCDVTDVLYDGSNAHSVRSIQVHPHSDHWYIHNVSPGRWYVVDFGTTTSQGQFFCILRSNAVEVPHWPPFNKFEPCIRFSPVAGQNDLVVWRNSAGRVENSNSEELNRRWPYEEQFDGYTHVDNARWRSGKERSSNTGIVKGER